MSSCFSCAIRVSSRSARNHLQAATGKVLHRDLGDTFALYGGDGVGDDVKELSSVAAEVDVIADGKCLAESSQVCVCTQAVVRENTAIFRPPEVVVVGLCWELGGKGRETSDVR